MADADAPPGGGGFFKKRIGPLPAWGWAVAVGGAAIVGFLYWRHSQGSAAASGASAPAAATDSTAATDAANTSPGSNDSGYSGGQGSSLYSGSDSVASQLQQIETQVAAIPVPGATTPAGTATTPPAATSGGTNPPANPPSYSLLTSGASMLAAAKSNLPMFLQLQPGVFTAYTGGIAGVENAIKLGNPAGRYPIYTPTNGSVTAPETAPAPVTTPPPGMVMQPGVAVSTPPTAAKVAA